MSAKKFWNLGIGTLSGLIAFPLFVLGLGINELLVWPATTLVGALISFGMASPRPRDQMTPTGPGKPFALAAALGATSGLMGFVLYEMSDAARFPWALGAHLVGSLAAALVGASVPRRKT